MSRVSSSTLKWCATTIRASPRRCRKPRVLRVKANRRRKCCRCCLDGFVLRLRVDARNPDALAAGAPRNGSPMAIRSRRSATSRAFALGIRLFSVDCAAEVEKIAVPPAQKCSAASSMIAPARMALSRSSAAIRRWRSRCSTSPSASPRAVRHLVPCRLAAAQGEGVDVRWRWPPPFSATAPSAASTCRW